MFQIIYEWLKLNFSVTGNPITDMVITAAIFSVFNQVAYSMVGDFYRSGMISGRSAGSNLNFIIKIILILLTMFVMWVFHSAIGFYSDIASFFTHLTHK